MLESKEDVMRMRKCDGCLLEEIFNISETGQDFINVVRRALHGTGSRISAWIFKLKGRKHKLLKEKVLLIQFKQITLYLKVSFEFSFYLSFYLIISSYCQSFFFIYFFFLIFELVRTLFTLCFPTAVRNFIRYEEMSWLKWLRFCRHEFKSLEQIAVQNYFARKEIYPHWCLLP